MSPHELGFLARGLVIGFSIAAPVGPIGVLCIRRTLAEGRAAGFLSGLGAASADAAYGAIAAFGLTAVSRLLTGQHLWLRLVGGVFLCYLGVRAFAARPADQTTATPGDRAAGDHTGGDRAAQATGSGLMGAYASTMVLTLTNPMTILSFAAVFAGLGLAGAAGSPAAATLLVAGVFLGSAAWWLTLSTSVGLVRARVTPEGLRWVNRVSGGIILGFGVVALVGAFL